jgi:hypothetical protein
VWLASYIVLSLVVLVLAFLLAGSLRQLGLIQLRLGDDPGAMITDSGLERGIQAPEFVAAHSETEEPVSLYELPPVPRLLVFASPGCLSCRELIPGLNEVRKTRSGEFDFLVICRGDIESCRSFGRMNCLEAPNHDCTDLSCHCFTNMAVPCTPRLHSGDQPCECPPAGAPIRA